MAREHARPAGMNVINSTGFHALNFVSHHAITAPTTLHLDTSIAYYRYNVDGELPVVLEMACPLFGAYGAVHWAGEPSFTHSS